MLRQLLSVRSRKQRRVWRVALLVAVAALVLCTISMTVNTRLAPQHLSHRDHQLVIAEDGDASSDVETLLSTDGRGDTSNDAIVPALDVTEAPSDVILPSSVPSVPSARSRVAEDTASRRAGVPWGSSMLGATREAQGKDKHLNVTDTVDVNRRYRHLNVTVAEEKDGGFSVTDTVDVNRRHRHLNVTVAEEKDGGFSVTDTVDVNRRHRHLNVTVAEEKDGGFSVTDTVDVNSRHRHLNVTVARRQTIVYSCNKLSMCGGWADRQKGIVSAYVLSVLMDRDFKLDMPRPCDVSVFLSPNQVDWKLHAGDTAWGRRSDVEGIDSHGYDLVKRMLAQPDLRLPELTADHVFITWNMELVATLRKHTLAKSVTWLAEQVSLAEVYNYVLRKLFTPSAGLGQRLAHVLSAPPPGTRLACAQVRMGGSPTFTDTETFNSLGGLHSLLAFLARYNHSDTHTILFASDSLQHKAKCSHSKTGHVCEKYQDQVVKKKPKFYGLDLSNDENTMALEIGRNQFPNTFMETSGPITHVDKYQGRYACAGFGRAILDQLVLATCDVLVISESGLGKIAAFLRNTDRGLYLFHDQTVTEFRRDLGFPNRYYW